jgi:hypothetical protein
MFAGWRPCGGKAWSSAQVTATGLLVRDHLERAGQFEAVQRSPSPARITVLSWQSLDELPGASGATWLDKQLVARSPEMIASRELGAEVEVALRSRRQWLLEEGLAHEQGGRIVYARNLLQALQRRELAEVSARVTRETGLDYAETKPGDWITGNHRRMLTLHSGRFANDRLTNQVLADGAPPTSSPIRWTTTAT